MLKNVNVVIFQISKEKILGLKIVDIAIKVTFIHIIKTIKIILSKCTTKLTQLHITLAHFDHYAGRYLERVLNKIELIGKLDFML